MGSPPRLSASVSLLDVIEHWLGHYALKRHERMRGGYAVIVRAMLRKPKQVSIGEERFVVEGYGRPMKLPDGEPAVLGSRWHALAVAQSIGRSAAVKRWIADEGPRIYLAGPIVVEGRLKATIDRS